MHRQFSRLIVVSRQTFKEQHLVSFHITANVDWALMNFMRDWFPHETKEKLKQNEKEIAEEELKELGFNPNACVIG